MRERPVCQHCDVPLRPEQDWCVECGTARPGRLGQRPGWRAAVSVVGATLALAGGATAAAYAALSSDAAREATAPAAGRPDAAPVVAQAPAVPAPPAETVPPVVAPPASADPAPVTPLDPVPATPAPAPDPTPAPAPAPDPGPGPAPSGDDQPEAPDRPATVRVDVDGAATFDPDARIGAEDPPDPDAAIDGDDETAWTVPAPDGEVGVGLLLTLDRARALRSLEFDVLTPGLTVEVLASDVPEPPTALEDLEPIDTLTDVDTTERVALAARYRQVLLWVRDSADVEAAITEVRLRARR